jgi:hypothetical protein
VNKAVKIHSSKESSVWKFLDTDSMLSNTTTNKESSMAKIKTWSK